MRKCIIHIPWKMLEESVSATEIRPRMMIAAFREIGYEPLVITGDSQRRKQLVSQLKQSIHRGVKYDFLYSESHTLPMMLTDQHHLPLHPFVDVELFALCKKQNIPIGLFYRDIYWTFPELKRFSTLKAIYTGIFHRIEILLFNRYLKVLFFPSDSRDELMKRIPLLKRDLPIKVLMPGAPQTVIEGQRKDYFVFVGSVDHIRADISLMLRAFARYPEHRLYICTPKKVWEINKGYYSPLLTANIRIVHYVNNEVTELLSKAQYALSYFYGSGYRDIAIPFKLFEYMGCELPVICNRDDAAGRFLSEHGIGYPIEYSFESLCEFLENPPAADEYQANVKRIAELKTTESWANRARYVSETLTPDHSRTNHAE